MVTDEEISEAVESLLREPNRSFSTLKQVVEELQLKLGGQDLTHKVDFIAQHINLLFQSQQQLPQQQQQQQQPPPKDHFALSQNPNYHPAPVAVPVANGAKTEAYHPVTVPVAGNVVPEGSTQTKPKRRGGPGGLNKLCGVSPELQVIVGQPALPRTEIVKQLWAYIRKNNLQDPSNKRKIICNDELRVVFETDCTDMFKMNKLLAKHIIPLEPTKQPISRKRKVEVESGTQSAEPEPAVIISDALADFFGISGREMLQSEVLRRIWEYIKINQLEDPVNHMAIACDAKLRQLFGCESISELGIHEVLGRHHILRRT